MFWGFSQENNFFFSESETWPTSSPRSSGSAPTARLKSAVRAAREAANSGDKKAAEAALKNANRKLDKAVSKGVVHKNQAANRKSAIAKKVASL